MREYGNKVKGALFHEKLFPAKLSSDEPFASCTTTRNLVAITMK